MKRRYGAWIDLPGVSTIEVAQIREARYDENHLYLYTVNYNQDKRALEDSMIEVFISSPRKDIIRLESRHFSGSRAKMPKFELDLNPQQINVTETDTSLTVISGNMRLEINKNPAYFDFYYNDKYLTSVAKKWDRSYISYVTADGKPYMDTHFAVDVAEKLYGLGERFTPFVKNGQSVDIWNEDGGTCTEIAYKNIPFYISNKGYGIFANDPGPVSFEVCSEQVSRVQISVPGEKTDIMVIGGEDMKGVLSNYCALTGYPALPPAWTFGLWLTSSFTTSYDEDTVTGFVDGMREREIPLSVFHYDCFWMKENEWCNFKWDTAMFPDPVAMLKRMKEKNLHICVWINPYIGQKSPLFDEAMEKNYLLNRENGDVWQWDRWQSGMGLVDFTNPDAYKWYQDKLRALVEMGVDCFKTDFGERIPTDVKYFDGSDPVRMHNYYTYLYNKCVFSVLEEYKGKNQAVLFARSATVGCQKFPVHWGGDCTADYLSMAESLRGGLSLCMSGFGFWSHDISGFANTAPHHLFKRWVAFGLLSTHSRLHGDTSYRVPWLFNKEGEKNGEEACAVTKHFAELKCSLMPYIYGKAVEANKTGVPVMRAMTLEFENEIPCHELDRQYMLGESLLVAPVLKENGEVDYYLPDGKWTHLLSNEVREGGKWQRDKYDFFSLPLYIRENTILPIGKDITRPDYDYGNGITLHIFELNDKAEITVYGTDSNPIFTVKCEKNGNTVRIFLDKLPENAKVLLRNITDIKAVFGAVKEACDLGTVLNLVSKEITVQLYNYDSTVKSCEEVLK
ncbi:MAG: alpha-xylosidase [Clostridia bacterium]|nr:alpha-xylosidase [Clostridia bacterium]